MTTSELYKVLKSGKNIWNTWRKENPEFRPNLRNIELPNFDFTGYNLADCDLSNANLQKAIMIDCQLTHTSFIGANLEGSTIGSSKELFQDDPFFGLNIRWSNFSASNMKNSVIKNNLLEACHFIKTDLRGADISNCRIHGVNAWEIKTDSHTKQNDLIVTAMMSPVLKVDQLEIAQFFNFIIENKNIAHFINVASEKIVLILGSFAKEDKHHLDQLKFELREKDLLPILFDFEKPKNRSLTETIVSIALLSRFVIADLTNERSIGHELANFVKNTPNVPLIPLVRSDYESFSMFEDYYSYQNVLEKIEYTQIDKSIIKVILDAVKKKEEDIKKVKR